MRRNGFRFALLVAALSACSRVGYEPPGSRRDFGSGDAELGKDGPFETAPMLRPDAPKADATKPDAAKPDAPKADAAKPDAAKPDAPKADAAKPDLKADGLAPLVLGDPSKPATWPWVRIKAGVFKMGSPVTEAGRNASWETQHQVTLTKDFDLLATEVTLAQYRAVMGADPGYPSTWASCTLDNCPATNVDQNIAATFCNKLSDLDGLPHCDVTKPYACKGYRLPTEAEWEYAARAGTQSATYNGDLASSALSCTSTVVAPIAWFCGNSSAYHPVGLKAPNAWGLYDMLGNALERTLDRYGEAVLVDYHGGTAAVVDPFVWVSAGPSTANRGGTFASAAADVRAAFRFDSYPDRVYNREGFRVVRPVP